MKELLKYSVISLFIELLLTIVLVVLNLISAKLVFISLCLFMVIAVAYIFVCSAKEAFDDIDTQLDEYMGSDSPEPEYEEIEQDYDYWPDRY